MEPEIKCRRVVVNLNLQEIQSLNSYRIAYGKRGFKCARSAMEKVIEAWKVAGKESLAVGNAAAMREFAEYVASYPTCKGCNGQTDSRFCESCPKGVALAPLALKARLAISVQQTVHNAAAMREALLQIVEIAKAWADPGADAATTLGLIIDRAEDALALPLRNCDVGTADEQRSRFEKFCNSHCWEEIDGTHCSSYCPLYHGDDSRCEDLEWAQMPYTAGAAKQL